jgi:hypothetical protein
MCIPLYIAWQHQQPWFGRVLDVQVEIERQTSNMLKGKLRNPSNWQLLQGFIGANNGLDGRNIANCQTAAVLVWNDTIEGSSQLLVWCTDPAASYPAENLQK